MTANENLSQELRKNLTCFNFEEAREDRILFSHKGNKDDWYVMYMKLDLKRLEYDCDYIGEIANMFVKKIHRHDYFPLLQIKGESKNG